MFQNTLTLYSRYCLSTAGGELLYLAITFGSRGEKGAVSTVMGDGEGVVGKSKGVYGAGRVTTKTTPNQRHNDQSS